MTSPHQRRKRRRRTTRKLGVPPGTVTVDPGAPPSVLWLFAYGPDHYEEKRTATVDDIARVRGKYPVVWVNIDGLGDAEILRRLGELFGLHPLTMEDVVNVHQRPKAEEYSPYEFIVVRTLEGEPVLEAEQISILIGADFVLTFQERAGDTFEPTRDRIRRKQGRVRTSTPDYLAYHLIDSILDHYFPLLEKLGDRLEVTEDAILAGRTSGDVMAQVYETLQELRRVRQAVLPLRDVLSDLSREPCPHIKQETRIYLRDAYDHTRQLFDQLDAHRETAVALMDLHLARINQRMNEVIKVLTIISTIFLPLSFITGFFGMNFRFLPGAEWEYGVAAAAVFMLAVGVGMLWVFKRNGWM